MNVQQAFDNGGWLIPNPNYKKNSKKNKEPKYVLSSDPSSKENSILDAMTRGVADSYIMGDTRKIQEYGVTPYKDMDMNAVLAENQSAGTKLFNALAQTIVSEIGLGTLKGAADLFDMITLRAFGSQNDYSNPLSAKLSEWQEKFNNEVAPIYTTPGVDISNGGLLDVGWWANNIPSIASSLTLLIPSTGVTKGLSWLGKTTKAFDGIGKARKALTGVSKLEKGIEEATALTKVAGLTTAEKATAAANLAKAEKAYENLDGLSDFAKWINKPSTIKRANQMAELGVTGFTSRIMENYQEANQVYSDLLPEMQNTIAAMSSDEYQDLIDRNKDVLDGIDTSNTQAVVKALAKEAANRTFQDDLINGLFDVYELYGLRNIKRFMNAPMRASLRRRHLASIRYAGKYNTADELDAILANRTKWQKVKDKIADGLWGSKTAVAAQLSEGVEEAVNYISQQEGMTYGHYLLGMEKDNSKWDQRLANYFNSPQLYESAFWGVMGGVTFQAAGSHFNRLSNAIETKTKERKHKKTNDEDTEVKRPTTSWSKAFEDKELQSRKDHIDGRAIAFNNLKTKITQIEDGINPWNTNEKLPEGQKQIAKDRAYNEFVQRLMMDAMFSGNWNITKAYLQSNEVKQALVEAKVLTQEEADRRQFEISTMANKLEDSYDRNMRVVENALRGKDEETGIDLKGVPYEFYQIIAASNMQHELNAEQYDRDIAVYQPRLNTLETQLATDLAKDNVDYKRVLRAFILAKDIGEVEAELDATKKTIEEGRGTGENDIDPRTITGQNAIKELELRRDVLYKMLDDFIGTNTSNVANIGNLLTILRAKAATEKNNKGGYQYNTNSEKYKKLDDAITKAYNEATRDIIPTDEKERRLKNEPRLTDDEWSALMTEIFGEEKGSQITREQFKDIAYNADLFNEQIGFALGANGVIASLQDLSPDLLTNFGAIVNNEIARNYELAHVARGKKAVLQEAQLQYNQIGSVRGLVVETATQNLIELAKRKYDEYGDISDLLAFGTLDVNKRNQLKTILSDDELKTYDDLMRVLSLTTKTKEGRDRKIDPSNLPLPRLIKNAIYWSARDKFENVVEEKKEEEPIETVEEVIEKSSTPKDTTEDEDLASPIVSTPLASKSSTTPSSPQNVDFMDMFSIKTTGEKLPNSQIDIIVKDDGTPIIASKVDDSTENPTADLVPVEGEDDVFDLEFRSEPENDPLSDNIFGNDKLFNGTDKRLEAGAVITKLPRVTLDKDGNILEIAKGEIGLNKEAEVPFRNGDTTQSSISPIGEEESSKKSEDEASLDDFNEDETQEEFNMESFTNSVTDNTAIALRRKIRERKNEGSNEAITEEELKELVQSMIEGSATPEQFEQVWNETAAARNLRLDKVNSKFAEASDINDLHSAISDSTTVNALEAQKLISDAFAKVLNNYLSHVAVDEYSNKKIISLSDLLRYCNDVMADDRLANALYDTCVRELQNDNNYKILETTGNSRLQKGVIIENSKSPVKEIDELDKKTIADGKTLTFDAIINRIKQNIEKGTATQEDLNNFYDLVYNLKPGDKLHLHKKTVTDEKGKTFQVIEFSVNGKSNGLIGGIVVAKEKADTYEFENNGWLIDVPKSNGSAGGIIEQLCINFMINPNNDTKYFKLQNLFKALIYTDRADIKGYKESLNNFYTELKNVFPKLDNYISSDAKPEILVKYLLDIYNGIRSKSEQWLDKYNMTKEEYEKYTKNERISSIHNWFVKIYDSAISSQILWHNPNAEVVVHSNNIGGLIIDNKDNARPVNEEGVIGLEHKGKVFVAVKSIRDDRQLHIGNGTIIPGDMFSSASTFIAIHKPDGTFAYVHAFPRTLGSFDKTSEPYRIGNDIRKVLRSLFDIWSKNTSNSSDSIYDFFAKLCTSKNQNTPLFLGLQVSKMTNGHNGFEIQYKENGVKKYIKIYDNDKYGHPVNVIVFPDDERGTVVKQGTRTKVLNRLFDIIDNNLKYNLDSRYVSNTGPLSGFASRKADGSFVIQLPGCEAHTFNSFNDFVINEGLVNVTTHADGTRNFYKPGTKGFSAPSVRFSINPLSSTISSTGEIQTNVNTEQTTDVAIGDELKTDLNNHVDASKILDKLINKALTNSSLKIIKNSRILKQLPFKNIIFVNRYYPEGKDDVFGAHINSAKIIDGKRVKPGDIVVTQKWIDLLNSYNQNDRDEAFRHLVHEGIHAKLKELNDKQRSELFKELRNIFDEFVIHNKANNENSPFEYTFDTDRYYTDGKINERGLEEFLIESLTRPELIYALNNISTDGNKITKQKIGNSSTKNKNLLQRILAAIAKAFGLRINKGSLLAKEYKLFEKIGLDFSENTRIEKTTKPENEFAENKDDKSKETKSIKSKEPIQLTLDFKEETPVPTQIKTPTPKVKKVIKDVKDINLEDEEFDENDDEMSAIADKNISSTSSIRDNLEFENGEMFDKLINNGVIKIKC